MLVMFAPISGIYKLADATGNICFVQSSFVNRERHLADYIVPMIAR